MDIKKTTYTSSALFIFFTLFTNILFAQTGKISGKVTDKKTGETLIGLTVGLEGSTKGSATDVEGRYTLNNLSSGKYKVTFRYLGYQSKDISDVEVTDGKVTNLDVVMEEAASQNLAEVVITATARQESVSTLYAQQKNNATVSSGISNEQIRRSPDRNTSEVLKRVSGASIQENKFVIVRGLSDRYNSARLNNALLPSSEPDRKSFSFDIIPSNLVDNLVINKTASADLPGDFTGGLVTINTKDFPEENFINIQLAGGYNSESTFNDFRSGPRGKQDFLGFDDGDRQIPSGFPSSRERFNLLPLSQKLQRSRLFKNSFNIENTTASPIQNYQLTYGAVKNFKNNSSFGSIVSLTYRNSENINNSQRLDYDTEEFSYNFDDDIYRYSTNVGLLANFSYKFKKNKLSFKNIINKTLEDSYTFRQGVNIDNGVARRSNTTDLTDKLLVNSQFDGEHVFGKKDWKINWNLNYTFSYRDQPDLRITSYAKDIARANDDTVPYLAEVPSGSSASRPLSRFYSRLDDYANGGSASLLIPFNFNKEKSTLKIGGLALLKDRDFNARILGYVSASPSFDNSLRLLPPDQIFAPENIRTDGFVLNEITNNNDKYTATADIYAGYFMFDNRLTKKLRLSWGARGELYVQNLDGRGFSNEKVDADVNNFDILPSFNLTYNLTEKTNLRLSGSQTVSRPELRELAPFQYYDFVSNSTTSGNPDLIRSKIYNADFKYEYYPGSGEVLSGGIFYKNFQDPIEQIIPPGSNANNRLRTFANANSALTYGFEIEFRKKLDFLGSSAEWLKDLTLFSNFAYIKSEVDLTNTNVIENDRPLQGQSPYLINGGVQYSNTKSNFVVNVLYNRIGQRISDVGFDGYPSIYENSRDLVDVQLSKRVFKNKGELRLNIADILNQDIVFYQNQSDKKAFDKNIDRSLNTYKPGTNISLTFNYNFSLNRIK